MGGFSVDLETLKDTPPWEWPAEAGRMFLGVLADNRAKESDRLLAAELAGDFTVLDDEIAEALLTLVASGEESDELRGTAAISLGAALEHADMMEFEDAEENVISEPTFRGIQRALRELFDDTAVPQDVRRRILEASVRAPEDWHKKAVRAAYAGDDEAWRLTAVFCMRFVPGFDDRILEALKSEDPEIHYQAVCAAGSREVDAAWAHVAPLVTADETDKPLRLAAIDAAASIRPLEAAEILSALTDSDDEDIADAAFEALAMAGAAAEFDEDEDDDDQLR
jgi:hypothetical protein